MTDDSAQKYQTRLRQLASELHLWLIVPAAITDPEVIAACRESLSAAELARYRAFRFERDRHLFLVTHALVRRALSHYADVAPAEWLFRTGAHGKPEIHAPELPVNLHFNSSHTRGLAACLVTRDVPCGVDAECLSRHRDAIGIGRRMFAPREQAELGQLAGAALQERFLEYWTLREAYGKALGTGLAGVGRDIWFESQPPGGYRPCHAHRPDAGDWVLSVLRPLRDCVLALAVPGSTLQGRAIRTRWLEF